jgi:hypothetical protein
MQYVDEIGSVDMTYIPSFINTGSGIKKFMGRGGRRSQRDNMEIACFYFTAAG